MQTDFAAYVAIDSADRRHAWMLQTPGSSVREAGNTDHTPEAVDFWAAELRLGFAGQPIPVALEQSLGPLVFMLTKYEHLVIPAGRSDASSRQAPAFGSSTIAI
jgi:hypothetical protein